MIADHVKLNIINDNRFVRTGDDFKELLEVDYYDINDCLYSSGKINISTERTIEDTTHFMFIFAPSNINIENISHLTKLSMINPSKIILCIQRYEIHKGEIIKFDDAMYAELNNMLTVLMRMGVQVFASAETAAKYVNSLSKTHNKVEHHSV